MTYTHNIEHGKQGFQRTHGLRKAPEYQVWNGMKHRCHNPNYGGFKKYGARGIVVCDEWRNSFETFYRDMGPRPSPKHSLERIDNDGPYAPENCRWATLIEQANNKRRTHILTYQGKTQTLMEWAAELGYEHKTLRARIWPDEEVLGRPLQPRPNPRTSRRVRAYPETSSQ